MRHSMILLALFFAPWTLVAAPSASAPVEAIAQLNPTKIGSQQGTELKITLQVAKGYRAYADKFELHLPAGSQFKLGKFQIAPLHEFFDETSKKKKMGVIGIATLIAPLEAPASLASEKSPLVLKLTYQACTDTFCLFPKTTEVPVAFEVAGAEAPPADGWVAEFFRRPFHEVLRDNNIFLSLFMIFIAGFLTSLTPCVFPMIPITMAVLGREAHARTRFQTFLVSNVYVLGIAITYALLGVFAASTGILFGSFMNSPWILGFICVVFLAMSLSMFGLYDIEAPPWLQNKIAHAQLHGYGGVFLTGVLAGVVASPCVGPVLVAILTYVAQTKNLWIGFWSLFVFALGMGQLFLILGMFSSATRALPRSGAWMEGVKHFFGLLMLAGFYYYLHLLLPARWWEGAVGLGAIALGSLKGAFEKDLRTPWQKVRKGLCFALILGGALLIANATLDLRSMGGPRMISEEKSPAVQHWESYSEDALKAARQAGQPVIIDFFADWCAACKELEQFTFADPRFIEETKSFKLLRFDATQDSDALEALKKQYGIVGLPTVVFLNPQGEWQKELTLTAFEETEPFLKRVRAARGQ